MYLIIEQQTAADGSVAIPPVQSRENRNEAYGAYYQVLAAAAVSSVPMHSAALLDSTGAELEHRCFTHEGGAA